MRQSGWMLLILMLVNTWNCVYFTLRLGNWLSTDIQQRLRVWHNTWLPDVHCLNPLTSPHMAYQFLRFLAFLSLTAECLILWAMRNDIYAVFILSLGWELIDTCVDFGIGIISSGVMHITPTNRNENTCLSSSRNDLVLLIHFAYIILRFIQKMRYILTLYDTVRDYMFIYKFPKGTARTRHRNQTNSTLLYKVPKTCPGDVDNDEIVEIYNANSRVHPATSKSIIMSATPTRIHQEIQTDIIHTRLYQASTTPQASARNYILTTDKATTAVSKSSREGVDIKMRKNDVGVQVGHSTKTSRYRSTDVDTDITVMDSCGLSSCSSHEDVNDAAVAGGNCSYCGVARRGGCNCNNDGSQASFALRQRRRPCSGCGTPSNSHLVDAHEHYSNCTCNLKI